MMIKVFAMTYSNSFLCDYAYESTGKTFNCVVNRLKSLIEADNSV